MGEFANGWEMVRRRGHAGRHFAVRDALINANKSFDLLYLPNPNHDFARTDFYFIRRKWDYFVEHLLGARPPSDFQAVAPPPARWQL